MDWLGSIGGVEEMLTAVIIFCFGGYAQFNATISTFDSLVVRNNATEHGDISCDSIENEIKNQSTFERLHMYLIHCYKCFSKIGGGVDC